MNRQRIALGIAAIVIVALAAPFLPGLIFTITQGWPPGDGEVDRYRTATTITVAEGDRTVSNTIHSDCIVTRGGDWSTGKKIGISRRGPNPFVVLSDRSILVLRDLELCVIDNANPGTTYTFDPDIPARQIVDGRIAAHYSHAYRYQDIDDARTLTLYSQQELFRRSIDGVRIAEAKLVVIGRQQKSPLPNTYAEAFPWHKRTPRVDVGSSEYTLYDHATRFSGFNVKLNQLNEAGRCAKFDREAEGPILVVGDRWDTCPPWGGDNLGWLIAKPNAELNRIDYSYNERSKEKIATQYRATWLEARGAPGVKEAGDYYFFWRPVLCFDGQCFETHAARRSIWGGFRLYYPKKNQVIAVEWVH